MSSSLIWSIRTMAFLMSMPERLMRPSSDMNPKGWSKSIRPAVTPMTDRGTVSQMTKVFLRELKRQITMKIMSPKKMGTELARRDVLPGCTIVGRVQEPGLALAVEAFDEHPLVEAVRIGALADDAPQAAEATR